MKNKIENTPEIEKKEFKKVGGEEIITTDFRLICATNKDLKELIK